MPLKLTLKPNERVIIGGAVITNGKAGTDFIIENNVPVLRQKDILNEKDVDTPCKRIYLSVQLMYVDETNLREYHKTYLGLIREVIKAAPSTKELIEEISTYVLGGKYYQALKAAKKLIKYEQEVTDHVRTTTGSL